MLEPDAGSTDTRATSIRPPVTVAFLAPAVQCNQRCPNCYITEVGEEPVHNFDLGPNDYAQFVGQFLDAGIPVLSVKFQGFEVTLPQSWPYLEAVFQLAQRHRTRRSFITNGMLLHKWTERVQALDVARVSVSLDGASPRVNDRFRGIDGAFDATTQSIRRFLRAAPEYRERLVVASLLRPGGNFASLLDMPQVLGSLGISHWVIAVELGLVDDGVRPLFPRDEALEKLERLRAAATDAGVEVHVSDEYGALSAPPNPTLPVHTIPEQRFFYRVYPTGEIHVGKAVFAPWNPERVRRWDPSQSLAPDVVGYRQAAEAWIHEMGIPSEGRE